MSTRGGGLSGGGSTETLGVFSPFSFSKHLYKRSPRPAWEEALESSETPEIEMERRARVRFEAMSESERRAYVEYRATNLHETHHFHAYVLTGAGESLFRLFLSFLAQRHQVLNDVFANAAAGREPFEGVQPSPTGITPLPVVDYFMARSLPFGKVLSPLGTNPLTLRWQWGVPGSANGHLPVVQLNRRLYPVGAAMLVEGWTHTLTRALITREFGSNYGRSYQSTKDADGLWVYTLLEQVLGAILSDAYMRLDPVSRHTVCAAVALASLAVDPQPTDFQSESAHPGFGFAHIVDFLWATRDQFVSDGQLNPSDSVRKLSRFAALRGAHHTAARLIHVSAAATEPADEADLVAFGIHQYYALASQTVRAYVDNPAVFLDAGEWLVATRRETLPRIPMTTALAPGKALYHMRFPEEHTNQWFMWFLATQLLLHREQGSRACPLFEMNLSLGCAIDASCRTMTNLKAKGDACFWNGPPREAESPR